jgi:hypothetical protein
MKKSRLVNFSGILLLVVGLLFVFIFVSSIYAYLYDCEHLPGAVPVQGCRYFLQLPFYLWSGASLLLSGISFAVIGSGLILLQRFFSPK